MFMYGWVMLHIWICNALHMNAECHAYEWVISHTDRGSSAAPNHTRMCSESSKIRMGLQRAGAGVGTCKSGAEALHVVMSSSLIQVLQIFTTSTCHRRRPYHQFSLCSYFSKSGMKIGLCCPKTKIHLFAWFFDWTTKKLIWKQDNQTSVVDLNVNNARKHRQTDRHVDKHTHT